MGCIGDCLEIGPPPDMILSMPPPPLPSFLLPRSAIVALSGNDSQPCFTAFMCEPSPGPVRDKSGIEFIELTHGKTAIGIDDTWMFVLVSSCVGVLLLAALLAVVLLKCRDSYTNYAYQEAAIKQIPPTMAALGEPHLMAAAANTKPPLSSGQHHPFIAASILYPTTGSTGHIITQTSLQQQLAHDNRVLWAALTPHGGTRHFVADNNYTNQQHQLHLHQQQQQKQHKHKQQNNHHNHHNHHHHQLDDDDHYEIIEYNVNQLSYGGTAEITTTICGNGDGMSPTSVGGSIKRSAIKSSFDNTGFVDYDYEDPTPFIESDDMDSGYQEPQELVTSTLTRCAGSPRPTVSSPTRIEHPNIPPLNQYPHRSHNGTLNRKSTLSRRISDIVQPNNI